MKGFLQRGGTTTTSLGRSAGHRGRRRQPSTTFDFVPDSQLFVTCEEILKKSDGRTGGIQAVCLEYAKVAVDKRYENRTRPLGMALRLMHECELFENRADMKRNRDGTVSAPAVCGSFIIEDSEVTGTPLPEYIPAERLKPACVGAFTGEKGSDRLSDEQCQRSYGQILEDHLGLPGKDLAPTYCAQLREAVAEEDGAAGKKEVGDKEDFCARQSGMSNATKTNATKSSANVTAAEEKNATAAQESQEVVVQEGNATGIIVPARKKSERPPPFVDEVGEAKFGKGRGTGAVGLPTSKPEEDNTRKKLTDLPSS